MTASARVRVDYVAERLCITPRTVQDMAARGAIPGAARIGKFWTFDRTKFERFIAAREGECARKIYIGEELHGGCEPPSRESSTEKAYELAMSKLLGGSGTNASRR